MCPAPASRGSGAVAALARHHRRADEVGQSQRLGHPPPVRDTGEGLGHLGGLGALHLEGEAAQLVNGAVVLPIFAPDEQMAFIF